MVGGFLNSGRVMTAIEMGRLLYDDSQTEEGVRIRRGFRLERGLMGVFILVVAAVLTYILPRLFASFADNGISWTLTMVLGILTVGMMYGFGINSTYAALNIGFTKVYEKGIVLTRAHTTHVSFWSFSSMDIIIVLEPRKGRPIISIDFDDGFKAKFIRMVWTLARPTMHVGNVEAFLDAVRGQVTFARAEWSMRGTGRSIEESWRQYPEMLSYWQTDSERSGSNMVEEVRGKRENNALRSSLPDSEAVINPSDLMEHIEKTKEKKPPRIPKYCILAFFEELYPVIEQRFNPRVVHYPSEENPMFNPIHLFKYKDIDIAFVFPGIGAPNAGVTLEMMIAMGGEYFIILSAVGTLTEVIGRGEIIVPSRALRDEGTSFHYENPSRYSRPSELMLKCIMETLREMKISFAEGGTWTTDAIFRETRKEVHEYHQEGCLTVEMEAAALFSIAKFRERDIGALFAAGDCVAGKKWNPRKGEDETGKGDEEKSRLLDFALETLSLLDRKLDED